MTESNRKKESFTTMKNRLIAYRVLNEEIDSEIERLDRLHVKAESIGNSRLSGMPKALSNVYDRTADIVAKIVDIENGIKSLITQRDRERTELESLVSKLDHVGEKAVIRSRYIDLEEWNDVQFVLFGGKADFDEKYDDYRQKMYRWHRAAITNLAALDYGA